MRGFVLTLAAATCLGASAAGAQQLRAAAFTVVRGSPDTLVSPRPVSRAHKFWVRSLTATVGSIAGAYGGYQLGKTYTPHRGSDDTYLSEEEAVGLGSGFLLGAALGAALLSYDSSCSMTQRVLRGLGGAVLGFIPGAVIGPLGPAMGAAAGQGRC